MLKSYLTTIPCTKFVLIEDSLDTRGNQIFNFCVQQHLNRNLNKVHYFVYEGNFNKAKNLYQDNENLVVHNCVIHSSEWLDKTNVTQDSFENKLKKLDAMSVVVIDSLANLIFYHGIAESCKLLNDLKNNKNVIQIITTLHSDLLESSPIETTKHFSHLTSLHVKLEPKFMTDDNRLSYIYKKSGGKVYRQIEEYKFVSDDLITEKIKKPEAKTLIEKSVQKEINPDTLSTFKIGLSDEEKLSRDKVILPYLPESKIKEEELKKEEGKIFYQLDEMDDWDEEDPDDDLDF